MAEGFNVIPQLRQDSGLAQGLSPELLDTLAKVPGAPDMENPMSAQEAERVNILNQLSPEEFSALMQKLNTPQAPPVDELEQAIAQRLQPVREEEEKKAASAELDKEIESGKDAQKVKNLVKSIDDIKELRSKKQQEQPQ